jgi:hypothetical protein
VSAEPRDLCTAWLAERFGSDARFPNECFMESLCVPARASLVRHDRHPTRAQQARRHAG